jgi:multidrug resistance efflux pump
MNRVLHRAVCEPAALTAGSIRHVIVGLILAILAGPLLAADDDKTISVQDVVVEFASKVDVPSRQSGLISEFAVRQNQWVNRGDVIAKLDAAAITLQRRAASLRYESSLLVLQDNVEIQYAETALAEAQSELEDGQATSDQFSGSIARNQLRRMKLAMERAQLELKRAEKQREQSQIDLQLRAADLAMIDHELKQLECLSPIDGIVLNVNRDAGEWTHAGESLVTIADAAVLHLHALVDADMLDPSRCVGLPVSVHWLTSSDAKEASLRGKIISVDPTRLPGNRFRLHAEVENRRHPVAFSSPPTASLPQPSEANADGWQLTPGMSVTMKIHCSDAQLAWRKSRITAGSRVR